jgi:transposase
MGMVGALADRFDGGIDALPRLEHCAQRQRRLPEKDRTVWKGVLRDRQVLDEGTGRIHRLRIAPTIAWHRNPDAITSASTLDGLYAIATNLPDPPDRELTAPDVLDIYKDQWIVEQRHRELKQTLHVRPIFLHNDDRIHALVAVVGIATSPSAIMPNS